MNDRIRLAVVGCGDIAATRHLPTIVAHPGAELAALCDADRSRAEALAAASGVAAVRCTDDYRELLRDGAIDAAIVATPPWVTPQITMDLLKAGKHVLCEKPMALDVETAQQVAATELETGRKVQVGFTYRHDPLLERLRDWIRDDRLGSPLVYRLGIYDEVWNPSGDPAHYERIFRTMEHGIPSIHDGAHIADFLHLLTASPVARVDAFGLQSREEFPASNYDTSIIRFANGDLAKLEIAWFYPVFPQGEFEVLGPKGLAVFDRYKRVAELRTGDGIERATHEEDWWEACFRIQLDRFLAGIRSDGPLVPGTAEGIYSLSLTKAIEAAMARNRTLFSGGDSDGIRE